MTCNHNLSISTTGALKSTDIQSLIDAANPTDVIHINQYLAFNEAWTNDTYNIWKVKSDVVLNSTWFDTVKSTLDRKSTRLNSSHTDISRMPSSA